MKSVESGLISVIIFEFVNILREKSMAPHSLLSLLIGKRSCSRKAGLEPIDSRIRSEGFTASVGGDIGFFYSFWSGVSGMLRDGV